MELVKENVKVNQVICKGRLNVLSDEDIIVPDVQPDILKILQLDASAYVTEKRVVSGRVETSGRIDMKILYIPDSDKDKIKSISASFAFEQNIDNPEIGEDMTAIVMACVDKAEFSLTNSRKLRVKIIVGLDYEVVTSKEVELAVESEEEDGAEILRRNIRLQNCVGISESEFTIKENAEIPSGQKPIRELLKIDTKIRDCEYKTVSDKIVAKGAVAVCALYTDDESNIQFTESEIPFTEVFDCEGAGDDTVCDIDYSICDVRCTPSEDGDGDMRVLPLEINVRAQIKATENVSADMICDCYKPHMKTTLIKNEVELEEVVSRPSAQNTLREMIEVPSGAPAVSGVYDVITHPCITNAQLQNGRLIAEGKVEACILYLTDNSESPVYSMKKELPFSSQIDCGCPDDGLTPEIKAEVKHTAYNMNVAGEIELRCVLSLSANLIRKRSIELISDVVTEDMSREDKKGIVIYFTQSGDSLWEVAKRYAVPQEEIIRFNGINEGEKLDCGRKLFIPQR